jgi:hydroxymethylpyrimidine pyrophosphatase-like HAD family hydrolase
MPSQQSHEFRPRRARNAEATFGLLLDVDGPIASPITRRLDHPRLPRILVDLIDAGVPTVFNTGRSHDFVHRQVLPVLLAHGLRCPWNVHAVLEKGACWASADFRGLGAQTVDDALEVPAAFAEQVRMLVERDFSGWMFFDTGKAAMVSVEQRVDVPRAEYISAQHDFLEALQQLAQESRLGYRRLDTGRSWSTAAETVSLDIDPTIISVDVQAAGTGKALGARRALSLLRATGAGVPTRWFTVGDSPTDYAMADWLQAEGFEVTHVDVHPRPDRPDRPYRVVTYPDAVDDAAAVRFLATVRGETAQP